MKRHWIVFLTGVALLGVSCAAMAGETYWQHDPATPGDWFVSGNWTNGVPTSSDDAYVDNGGTAIVSGEAHTEYLHLGNGSSGSGSIQQAAGSFGITHHVYVGDGGTGRFDISGGSLTSGEFRLGVGAGGRGDLTVSGGYFRPGYLFLGEPGIGHCVQTGGTVEVYYAGLSLSRWDDAVSTYELRDGLVKALSVTVWSKGPATFIQTGGVNDAQSPSGGGYGEGVLTVGLDGPYEAKYELRGGDVLAREERIASGWGPSNGLMIQSGGANTVSGSVSLGITEAGGNGEYRLEAGSHTVAGSLQLGYRSRDEGLYRVSGGTLNAAEVVNGKGGQGCLEVVGGDGVIRFGSYAQAASSTLRSVVTVGGISPVEVSGPAQLDGTWSIVDDGAAYGRWHVLVAAGGITGEFAEVSLPGLGWSWGVDGSTTLWVGYLPLEVLIDVKPDSEDNPLNLMANGLLPVGVLGSDTFDVAQIDQGTLALAESTPEERGKSGKFGSFEDANLDGFIDLMLLFPIRDLKLDPDAVLAELTGDLLDGTPILGSDSVRLLRAGDANLDGFVDIQDFDILKGNFAVGAGWSEGDFNEDGIVDIQDFDALKGQFGSGAAVAALPEPATLALLALGGVAMLRSRRRAGR